MIGLGRTISWVGLWLVAAALAVGCSRDRILPSPEPDQETGKPDDAVQFRILAGDRECPPVVEFQSGCTIFVPAGTDLRKAVAKFNDRYYTATVNGVEQESGVTANDFTDFSKGVKYRLEDKDGQSSYYTVKVLDTRLPVIAVTTAGNAQINNRTDWKEARFRIMDADGKLTEESVTFIRGRGNWTWEKYPKKPYALKLEKKQSILGMPAHKRWVLLALYRGFIGNALMFEATRRAPTMPWAPRGQFVELVLNGKFQGLYFLCEQIKIDPNRVPIEKMDPKDVTYPAVSGGYLLEYDELYDEEFKFKSDKFNLPVQIKEPNDTLPEAQFDYIQGFINDMEAEIKKIGSSQESHYGDYLDVENFAEYWLILETICNYEAYKPRSVKMYKGRDGSDSPNGTVCKLKAGPLWDQELFLVDRQFNSKDMYYYKYLFKDPVFVQAVKARWAIYKDNILGNDTFVSFIDYLNQMVALIKDSANRDTQMWNNPYFTLSEEVGTVRRGFVSKINWMDSQINAL